MAWSRKTLPAATLIGVALLFVVARWFAANLGAREAFAGTMLTYWLTCWVLIGLSTRMPGGDGSVVRKRRWLTWLAWLPVVGVAGVATSKAGGPITLFGLGCVLCFAVVNGITEELFWRRTFTRRFPDQPTVGFWFPLVVFTIWHATLLQIPDLQLEGGAATLMGGAAVMGAIWAACYWCNRNAFVICGAHVSVNLFAFYMMACDNHWFPLQDSSVLNAKVGLQ